MTSVQRVTHLDRVWGILSTLYGATFMAVPVITVASDPRMGTTGWIVTGAVAALALVPLTWGLWHLLAPAQRETFDLETLREQIDRGDLWIAAVGSE